MIFPKTYLILEECVSQGVSMGIQRAYKHTAKPTKAYLEEQIEYYVMLVISEKFDFHNEQPSVQEFTNRITQIGFGKNEKDIQG